MENKHKKTAALRRVGAPLALLLLSFGLCVLALEFVLRSFPGLLPSGTYAPTYFDSALELTLYSGPVVYNKTAFNLREPNSEGYLDVEHVRQKAADAIRVGFFGDSYVEAVQVDIEDTFFRILSRRMVEQHIEFLAFGISGRGTVHSYASYEIYTSRYDLDVVVYVFVENDLGDNALFLQRARTDRRDIRPYAVLSDAPPVLNCSG